MGKEFENELDPINMADPDFWRSVLEVLGKNPDKVLPVYFESNTSKKLLGTYFMRVVTENGRIFIQAEDFDSPEFEKGFLIASTKDWEELQPGIYRLLISDQSGE